jgi:TetR/AcrR family transcriptional regulator
MMARTRNPEATRAAILDAAEEVFLKKGYGNTAMSEVATRAGVTKSLIHHHFGSKDELWTEIKVRRFQTYMEGQLEMLEGAEPSEELLRDSITYYFRYLQDNPELVRILAWMFLERDEICLAMDKELHQVGVAKLREAQELGQVRGDVDARFILFTFLGMIQHWFQDRQHLMEDFGVEGLPDDLDSAYLEALQKIFFQGIGPQSEPAEEG